MSRRAKEEFQRSYAVSDPRSHPKGYTEYKVTAKFVSKTNPDDTKEVRRRHIHCLNLFPSHRSWSGRDTATLRSCMQTWRTPIATSSVAWRISPLSREPRSSVRLD
uniref:Sorting nexin 15 n=1 Tax=Naja naja TaxID=35670 RepID=A0A8C6VIF0_NAJNA